jgi:prepilin-type N-terminal cleavage/methylation domain-containing protein
MSIFLKTNSHVPAVSLSLSLSLSLSERNNSLTNPKKAFTLLELIVVIVILGILATLGFSQYTLVVEKGRLAEAIATIGNMRQLAYEYYLKNGTLATLTNDDVGVTNTCDSSHYFRYWVGGTSNTYADLVADRCTSGGKTPNASRQYEFYTEFYPTTGRSDFCCYWSSDTSTGILGYGNWSYCR